MSGWGKGSENNNIGWGQGAYTATNGWGESQKVSYAGDTDILGDPALGISYPASALCENASNPTPTVSGNEGSGTFSSTTGLVFLDSGSNTSSLTGVVDVSTSTAGATYVITYTDTNAATATFSLTINNLDSAAFAYSASSYEPTGSDPTPTITGLSGGTFSSTSGLVFVDSGTNTGSSTGQIDLSATTEASYTITYDTTSSGSSVCPNTSTQTVEVAVAAIANNHSFSFDGSDNYIDVGSSGNVWDGTTSLSVSLWVKLNSAGAFHYLIDSNTLGNAFIGFTIAVKSNGKFAYCVKDDTNLALSYYVNDIGFTFGNWHHIVLVYDRANSNYYYYNNKTQYTITPSVSSHSHTAFTDLYIGRPSQSNNYYADGKIDEVAVWNTALTATQVQSIYDATGTNLTSDLSTVSGSNLKLWLRMGD